MDGMTDISKILGIIMENPDIIEKIKNLAGGSANAATETIAQSDAEKTEQQYSGTLRAEAASYTEKIAPDAEKASATVSEINTKKRRRDLLCAIKPYVSKERGKAIDTMLSVVDVIDIVKAR